MTLKELLFKRLINSKGKKTWDNIYINDQETPRIIPANILNSQISGFYIIKENDINNLFIFLKGYTRGYKIKGSVFDDQ